MVIFAEGSYSKRRRVPGTVNGVELYDQEITVGSLANGHTLCAFMRIIFASCATVIPPSIAKHLQLDSVFLFYFFCRLARLPGYTKIDALALARGDHKAIEQAISVLQLFVGLEYLSDVKLEQACLLRRPRRRDVFDFGEVRLSRTKSETPSPVKRKPSSVPNAFPESMKRSSMSASSILRKTSVSSAVSNYARLKPARGRSGESVRFHFSFNFFNSNTDVLFSHFFC